MANDITFTDIEFHLLSGPFAKEYKREVARLNKRANFEALHKKRNVKFFRNVGDLRGDRLKRMQDQEKKRRSSIHMDSRKQDMLLTDVAVTLNDIIHEDDTSNEVSTVEGDSSDNSNQIGILLVQEQEVLNEDSNHANKNTYDNPSLDEDAINGNADLNTNMKVPPAKPVNSKGIGVVESSKENKNVIGKVNGSGPKGNIKAPVPSSATTIRGRPQPPKSAKLEARHDQLQKWKKEKEVASKVAKRDQKQPFRPGGPAAPKASAVTKPIATANPAPNTKSRPVVPGRPATMAPAKSAAGSGPKPAKSFAPQGTTFTFSKFMEGQGQQQSSTVVGKVPAGVSKSGKPGPTGRTAGTAAPQPGPDRRVTRAMTKDQGPPGPGLRAKNAHPQSKPGTVPPPLSRPGTARNAPEKSKVGLNQKMKNLNINATSTSASGPSRAVAGVSATSKVQSAGQSKRGAVPSNVNKPGTSQKPTNSLNSSGNSLSSSSNSDTPSSGTGENVEVASSKNETASTTPPRSQAQPPAPVSVKSPKPNPFDAVYIKYIGELADASRKLEKFSADWQEILDQSSSTIPENVQAEIRSTLGKVKLLTSSKLPQFAQLLGSYLIPNPQKRAVVPCDLEGWWDVACIQLEIVYAAFGNLSKLKENMWMEIYSEDPANSDYVRTTAPAAPLAPRPRPQKKVQASSGLKAFLAQKKKLAQAQNSSNEKEEIMSSDTKEDEPSPLESEKSATADTLQAPSTPGRSQPESELEKTFDGGFFFLKTPTRKSQVTPNLKSRRVEELKQGEESRVKSPFLRRSSINSSSRDSLRRVSLTILNVRQSMGSLGKIGVVTPKREDEGDHEDFNSSFKSALTSNGADEIMKEVDEEMDQN